MDMNDVDGSLHEIEQMVLVALNAHLSLEGSDTAPGFFQMPAEDSELLSFSVHDLLKRVRALRAELFPARGLGPRPRTNRKDARHDNNRIS
jgi:hypothetical protein